jgi:6-phosphogluconolactonase
MIFVNYNKNVNIFKDSKTMAENLAEKTIGILSDPNREKFTIALAGGSTPEIFYKTLAQAQYSSRVSWNKVHLFWGDERCVPPDHQDSNYGMVERLLMERVKISDNNIHRIRGEQQPEEEVRRYSELLYRVLNKKEGQPYFDIIFLGLGSDGHTASLFPDSKNLNIEDPLCSVAEHPSTGQKRITLNLPIITNAKKIFFMVTGKRKSEIIEKILLDNKISRKYPASLVNQKAEEVEWFLDAEAGRGLE